MLIINLLIYILFYRLDKSSHFLSSREDNFSFPLGEKPSMILPVYFYWANPDSFSKHFKPTCSGHDYTLIWNCRYRNINIWFRR